MTRIFQTITLVPPLAFIFFLSQSHAQTNPLVQPIAMPDVVASIDSNFINLIDGRTSLPTTDISIGAGASALTRAFTYSQYELEDNFSGKYVYLDEGPLSFSYLENSDYIGWPGSTQPANTTLCNTAGCTGNYASSVEGIYGAPANLDYLQRRAYFKSVITNRDGLKLTYNGLYRPGDTNSPTLVRGQLTQVVAPDGGITKIYLENTTMLGIPARTLSVVNNHGYMLKYEYLSNTPSSTNFFKLTKITAINTSVDYCSPTAYTCAYSVAWPSWTYNVTLAADSTGFQGETVTALSVSEIKTINPLNNITTYNKLGVTYPSGRQHIRSGSYNVPGWEMGRVTYGYSWASLLPTDLKNRAGYIDNFILLSAASSPSFPDGLVGPCGASFTAKCVSGGFDVTRGTSIWHYDYVRSEEWDANHLYRIPKANISVRDPSGNSSVFSVALTTDDYNPRWPAIKSVKNELGKITTYDYSPSAWHQVTKVTKPEGNSTNFVYDIRENILERRETAKSGSGLTDRVWTANYSPTCAIAATCNKPMWSRDPKGNLIENANNSTMRTDYTYDATHGGLLTETAPADSAGVRFQTRYSYTPLFAKIKNSAGVLVNAEGPIYKLTKISTCRTATTANPASCVGTDQETVTEYEYTNNNLLLTKTTVRAGNANVLAAYSATNLWQSTSQAYDDIGNVVSVDGPLPGTVDQSFTTYDVLRRPILEISADPDDTGALKRKIIRHKYDLDGREYETDNGTCDTVGFSNGIPQTCSNFVIASYIYRTYDPTTGLEVKSAVMQP